MCVVDDCPKPRYQQSRYCSTHKLRLHRYGDLESRSRTGRTHLSSNGYLVKGGKYVHRLVLMERIGEGPHSCHWCGGAIAWRPFNGSWDGVLVVDHVDGVKTNNAPENLVESCQPCNTRRAVAA